MLETRFTVTRQAASKHSKSEAVPVPFLHRPSQAASPSSYEHNIAYGLGILKN